MYPEPQKRSNLIRRCLATTPGLRGVEVVNFSPLLPPVGTRLSFGPFKDYRHRVKGVDLNLSLEEIAWHLLNLEGFPGGFVWADHDEDLSSLFLTPKLLRTSPHPVVVAACRDAVYNSLVLPTDTGDFPMLYTPELPASVLRELHRRFRFCPQNKLLVDKDSGEILPPSGAVPPGAPSYCTPEVILGILASTTPPRQGRPRGPRTPGQTLETTHVRT